jgi:hypothetical protein
MARSTQQTFGSLDSDFKSYWKNSSRKTHGGIYSTGKRKSKRPFDSKKPIHLVVRSSRAVGSRSFWHPNNKSKVDSIVHKFAAQNGIKIFDYSNNGNHLHISLKAPDRRAFQKYLRTAAGLIPRLITKAKKGEPRGKFWDALAFTRVADWGRSFNNLRAYIYRNVLEAAGIIPYDRNTYKLIRLDRSG